MAYRKRKTEFAGVGALVQLLGVILFLVIALFPFGTIAGVLLFLVGDRMATKIFCSDCGNKIEPTSLLCPTCKAPLVKFKIAKPLHTLPVSNVTTEQKISNPIKREHKFYVALIAVIVVGVTVAAVLTNSGLISAAPNATEPEPQSLQGNVMPLSDDVRPAQQNGLSPRSEGTSQVPLTDSADRSISDADIQLIQKIHRDSEQRAASVGMTADEYSARSGATRNDLEALTFAITKAKQAIAADIASRTTADAEKCIDYETLNVNKCTNSERYAAEKVYQAKHTTWLFIETPNRGGGTITNKLANLYSLNDVSFSASSPIDQHKAHLTIMEGDGYRFVSISASTILNPGKLQCAEAGCPIFGRFDGGPLEHFSASGNDVSMMFVNPEIFLTRLRQSKHAYIVFPLERLGNVGFDFDVTGYKW